MTEILEAPETKTSQAQPDKNGYYGEFGGAYIPEMLYHNVETLRKNYLKITCGFIILSMNGLSNFPIGQFQKSKEFFIPG